MKISDTGDTTSLPLHFLSDLKIPPKQLFGAIAEGNIHCYCLLQYMKTGSSDKDFCVLYANTKLLRLLRQPEESVVGNYLSRIYPFSDNWVQCARYFQVLRDGQAILEEFPLEIFGQTRWYRHEVVPLSKDLLSITAEDITERKSLEKELVRRAWCDDLTGLKNRSALVQYLNSEEAKDSRISLVLIDIENFRSINQCFGSEKADQLLVQLSATLLSLDWGSCYRIFADTFALIFVTRSNQPDISELAVERLLRKLQSKLSRENSVQLKAGFSIADSADRKKRSNLMAEAEIALSEASCRCLKPVVAYSGTVMHNHRQRLAIGEYLPAAITGKEFFANFQPQYNLESGQVVGLEALCRWNHNQLGMVSPELFIDIAEQMHLLDSLDLQMLAGIVDFFADFPQPLQPVSLSVNASPANMQNTQYVDQLIAFAKRLPGWCSMEVEITENAWITDSNALKQSMIRLQTEDIGVALDDFGSGYSNLGYLSSFPFEKLKLDRCLIEGLETNARNAHLVSAAIRLAHRLGLRVVAEGVEDEFQRHWLQQAGCDIAQGYLLCKPLPASAGQRIFEPLASG